MHRTAQKPRRRRIGRAIMPSGARWQLQDAKAQFSRLVKEAQTRPQVITVRGEEVVVVQSIKDFNKSRSKGGKGPNLFEALLKCPPGPPLIIHRDPSDTVGAGSSRIFD